jgi:hypothetical protein
MRADGFKNSMRTLYCLGYFITLFISLVTENYPQFKSLNETILHNFFL